MPQVALTKQIKHTIAKVQQSSQNQTKQTIKQ